MARPEKRSRLARSQRPSGSEGFTSRLMADVEHLVIDSDYIPSDRELTDDSADDVGNSPNALSLSDDSDIEILPGPPIVSGLIGGGSSRDVESSLGSDSESDLTSEYEAENESASEEVLSVVKNLKAAREWVKRLDKVSTDIRSAKPHSQASGVCCQEVPVSPTHRYIYNDEPGNAGQSARSGVGWAESQCPGDILHNTFLYMVRGSLPYWESPLLGGRNF